MSIFVNLTGDARKDRPILANIKRAMGEKVFEETQADALKYGEVMYALLALHGAALEKRDWEALGDTERLRYGAIAQKIDSFFIELKCADCDHKEDNSINLRIPGAIVDTVKAVLPAIMPSILAGITGGKLVDASGQAPEMVNMPFSSPSPSDFAKIDEEVQKILAERERLSQEAKSE
jgi:hypothetical protein